jgi:SAM-dependent methyltransferase
VTDAEQNAARLAHESLAAGDPTGWFERLYAAAADGLTGVPWDRRAPSPLLVQWATDRRLRAGAPTESALVVGCGLGDDAEFVSRLGFRTTAFDISASAIRAARERFPDSPVTYRVADLLAPPASWWLGYDVVIESMTLQALPDPPRAAAIASLGPLVAPGGTLIVFARGREPGQQDDGPPWSLTRAEIDAIASGGLAPVRIDELSDPASTAAWRWRAEFRRERASGTGTGPSVDSQASLGRGLEHAVRKQPLGDQADPLAWFPDGHPAGRAVS